MKILLVDDSSLVREVLRSFIEKHGQEVIEAMDGQDGFEKAKILKPDLIITDALMPNVDGFVLLRSIKMDPNLSSIPCIFYSAIYTGSKDRELALSLGAEAFITKPKSLEELWEELKPFLERKKCPEVLVKNRLISDEKEFHKIHLAVVAAKLEEKVKALEEDATKRKQAEEEIRRLYTAIDQSINIVFITDVKGHIEYVNTMFEHVTGYAKEEVIGQNPRILASGETSHAAYEELWGTIVGGKTWRGIFKNKKKNGQYYWGNGLITPIRNEKGQITHFLAIQEDITEKMKNEERIKYLTTYDELTGLCNRTFFTERLNEWLSHNKAYNQTGVLLLMDIDGFRSINDTYGHSTGDNVLRHVAEFLTTTLFEIDKQYVNKDVRESILGRTGGDEFAIFLPARSEKEAMETAEEIRKGLEKYRFVEIAGHVTARIGVVLYPKDGSTTKELTTGADAAIYHAKELGHNRIHLYHTEDLVLEKMHSKMEWKGRIQKAIEEERFEPWFQPISDLKDRQIHHYEALARMRDANGEIILPGAFVDTAETLGLITNIDRIIIKKTLRTQSILCKQGKVLSFSVNLSGKDLEEKEFLEFLKSAITETGVDPRHLIFEITETAAVRNLDRAIKFIRELRSIGCCFSLDDFGVGFTSFKYLQEMEVDYIKIDGSFIRTLHKTQSDHIFVKAMADVARGMGIKTIAEFVENGEIIKILKEYGVDYAQGYFIGKPSPEV